MPVESSETRTFDQNDAKYKVCCGLLHVKLAARIVSVILVVAIVVNIIFSMNKSSTVILYSWVTAALSIGVYGSLLYAVFKEKKVFCLPFLFVQVVTVVLTVLFFLTFLIGLASSASMISQLQRDFWDSEELANVSKSQKNYKAFANAVVIVTLLFIAFFSFSLWILYVIYRFFVFLQDRESSFNFSLDSEFQMTV